MKKHGMIFFLGGGTALLAACLALSLTVLPVKAEEFNTDSVADQEEMIPEPAAEDAELGEEMVVTDYWHDPKDVDSVIFLTNVPDFEEKTVYNSYNIQGPDYENIIDWSNSTCSATAGPSDIIKIHLEKKAGAPENVYLQQIYISVSGSDTLLVMQPDQAFGRDSGIRLGEYGKNGQYKICGIRVFGDVLDAIITPPDNWGEINVSGLKQDVSAPVIDISEFSIKNPISGSNGIYAGDDCVVHFPVTDNGNLIYLDYEIYRIKEDDKVDPAGGVLNLYSYNPKVFNTVSNSTDYEIKNDGVNEKRVFESGSYFVYKITAIDDAFNKTVYCAFDNPDDLEYNFENSTYIVKNNALDTVNAKCKFQVNASTINLNKTTYGNPYLGYEAHIGDTYTLKPDFSSSNAGDTLKYEWYSYSPVEDYKIAYSWELYSKGFYKYLGWGRVRLSEAWGNWKPVWKKISGATAKNLTVDPVPDRYTLYKCVATSQATGEKKYDIMGLDTGYHIRFSDGQGNYYVLRDLGITFVKEGVKVLQYVPGYSKWVKGNIPKDPTRSGYTFAGWYNGDKKYNFDTVVNSDLVLTAKWTKNGGSNNPKKEDQKDEPKPDPSEETKIQVTNFVSRMYTVALNRDAEDKGLNDWRGQLLDGKSDGATLARGFICSNEFKNKNLNNEEFVDTLYHTFFDRDPDEGGRSGWLTALNEGKAREEVLAGFVNSAEFGNLCDKFGIARGTMEPDGSNIYNAGVRNFVLRNYTETLGRAGETAGVEDWSYRINKGELTMKDVAVSFLHSEEFLNKNLDNTEYVKVLYRTFLGREADDDGLKDWVGQLDSGKGRDDIVSGFSDSQEFANIMAQYQ